MNPALPGTTDKVYLGDGVYAQHDGWQIWLTTEDGLRITNQIALEPAVYRALLEYVTARERA